MNHKENFEFAFGSSSIDISSNTLSSFSALSSYRIALVMLFVITLVFYYIFLQGGISLIPYNMTTNIIFILVLLYFFLLLVTSGSDPVTTTEDSSDDTDTANPDTANPDTAKPDTANPDTAKPAANGGGSVEPFYYGSENWSKY